LFLWTAFLTITIIRVLNFSVDPGRIYRKDKIDPQAYADELIRSENGLWAPADTFSARSIKKALAKHAGKYDAVVIGSSHCMGLGIRQTPQELLKNCRTLLNLAVSGAGIEDHITLVHLSTRKQKPQFIILSIDPWTFAFGKDIRWTEYKNDYREAKIEIYGFTRQAPVEEKAVFWEKIGNLISLDYTIRALRLLLKEEKYSLSNFPGIPKPDPSAGGELPAFFRDGSYIHSASSIKTFLSTPIPYGGTSYKTETPCNTTEGVLAYKNLLIWIRQKKITPILMMTPYHENAWKVPHSANVAAMRATAEKVLEIAQELKLRVMGSFRPNLSGCQAHDFYDFMHLKPQSFQKIGFRESNKKPVPDIAKQLF